MRKNEIKTIQNKDVGYRLDNVLKKDKEINPDFVKEVLKSDIFYLLNNFFEVNFFDIEVKISVNENKKYSINISALGDRLKLMKKIFD